MKSVRTIYKTNNRKRADGLRILLDAAAHLRENNYPVNFETRLAIKTLLELSVKVVGNAIYMGYGLRIDRNEDGHLTLLGESNYHATDAGKLVRL